MSQLYYGDTPLSQMPASYPASRVMLTNGDSVEDALTIETGTITKVGNYYASMTVKKYGEIKQLNYSLSTSTSYDLLPKNTYTKVASLPEGFRPSENVYQHFYMESAVLGTVHYEMQVETNGDVSIWNYETTRPSALSLFVFI